MFRPTLDEQFTAVAIIFMLCATVALVVLSKNALSKSDIILEKVRRGEIILVTPTPTPAPTCP